MAMVELAPTTVAAFKQIVHAHLVTLDSAEFEQLRRYAEGPALSCSELIACAVASSGMSVNDVLGEQAGTPTTIAMLDDAPVYYLDGFYLWGRTPDSLPTLDMWVTWPAYPPTW